MKKLTLLFVMVDEKAVHNGSFSEEPCIVSFDPPTWIVGLMSQTLSRLMAL